MQTEMLVSRIRSASREMVRQLGFLNNRFSTIGSTSQCHALVELDAQGVMNIGQLSKVLNLDKSTTSRLITELYSKGVCQIQLDENDRRNKLISLSKKGVELAHTIYTEAKLQVMQALDMMSKKEQETVVKGLTIYAKALKRSRLQGEYKIRKLLRSDMPQLINLIKNVWAEFGFDSNHREASLFESELHETYEIFNLKRSHYYVLVNGKKIVGGVGFTPLAGGKEDTCELRGMYLFSKLRGQGLGRLLLRKILQEAKKEAFNKCYLETMNFMHGANALYKKFGFIQLDNRLGNTRHSWTNCWYIKELDNDEVRS